MEFLVPKYRRDPNEKIESIYAGVAHGNQTVVRVVKPSLDRNRMEATSAYGPGLARGQGGLVAVLVLGGMETTLDEMEYIVANKQAKEFKPRRKEGEIASMCRLLLARRLEQYEARRKYLKGNPSEAPKRKRVRFYLPTGYRFVNTPEPGFQVVARV